MKSKALVYLLTFVGMFLFGMSQRMDYGVMTYVIGFTGGLIVFRVVSTLDDKVTDLEGKVDELRDEVVDLEIESDPTALPWMKKLERKKDSGNPV